MNEYEFLIITADGEQVTDRWTGLQVTLLPLHQFEDSSAR